MKTLMTAAVALTLAAPASAQISNAEAYFAQFNDSAAEMKINNDEGGSIARSQLKGALANESPATSQIDIVAEAPTKADSDLLSFFAKGKDSAAERAARIE